MLTSYQIIVPQFVRRGKPFRKGPSSVPQWNGMAIEPPPPPCGVVDTEQVGAKISLETQNAPVNVQPDFHPRFAERLQLLWT